ncbi:hypothetical protein HMPREF0973_02965 [Prevotella veroralis F0319]|uniref:Uncharacterized protein n=1 Tax=Prevotella veroralis F0319 TaxID=649761 RepID=C9MTI9_9BACT|nr:hypothetical protein HMPREF0973_02965 [Prevotella veroralis F0319]
MALNTFIYASIDIQTLCHSNANIVERGESDKYNNCFLHLLGVWRQALWYTFYI